MPERVSMRFEGEGSGVGDLTWGQFVIWDVMQSQRSSLHVSVAQPVPAGMTVDGAVAGLGYLVTRHQSLRTRLSASAGGVRQVLAGSGEIAVEIADADGADPAETAEAVAQRFTSTNFDYADEWPLRLAVVRQRGVATHRVMVLSHFATDGLGALAMLADLADCDGTAAPPKTAVTAMQPLEQARWQRSPAGQRRSDAALRHWERLLRVIPARRFDGRGEMLRPRFQEGGYRSPAMYMAARSIAARTGFSVSTVLLAALAAAISEVAGSNPVVLQLVVSNRFGQRLAKTVSPVSQAGLCVIDVAGITLDEAVARTWRSATAASKNAYYDPGRQQELLDRVGRERGEEIDIACVCNDRRVMAQPMAGDAASPACAGPELRAALPHSTLRWDYQSDLRNPRLNINLSEVAGALDVTMLADTHCVPLADVEACLRGMEAVLVKAAFDPAARTGSGASRAPA